MTAPSLALNDACIGIARMDATSTQLNYLITKNGKTSKSISEAGAFAFSLARPLVVVLLLLLCAGLVVLLVPLALLPAAAPRFASSSVVSLPCQAASGPGRPFAGGCSPGMPAMRVALLGPHAGRLAPTPSTALGFALCLWASGEPAEGRSIQ